MDWSNCSLSTQRRSVSQIGSMNGKSIFEEGGEEIDSSTVFSKATLKRREKKHLRQSGVEEATIESQSTELEVLSNKPDSKQGKKKERKKNGLSTKAESKAAAEKPEDKCMKHHSSLLPNAEHETESLDALRLSGEKGRKVNQASNMVSSVATVSNTRRGGKVSESRIVQESSRQKTDRALKLNVRASKKVSQEALPGVGSAQAAMHVDECQVQVKQQKKKLGTIREDENPETVKAAQEGKEAAELYVSSQERQLAGNSSRKGKGKKKQRKVSFQSKKERSEEDAEKFSKSQRPVEIALVSSVAPAVTSAIRLAKKGELQSCKTRYFYTGRGLAEDPNSHDFVAEAFIERSFSTGHTVYIFANCCGQLGWPPRGRDSGPFTYKPCDHSRSLPSLAYHPGHLFPIPPNPDCGHTRAPAARSSASARFWSCCTGPLGARGCARRTDLILEGLIQKRQFDPASDAIMPPADEIFECAAYLTLLEATRGDSSTAEWARTVLHEVDDCSKLDWDAGRELLRRVLTEKESGGLSEDLWLRLDNRLRIWSCRVDLAAFDATILLQLHRLCLLLSKGNRKRAAALMKRMEEEARAKDTAGERPEARARAPETRCVCGEIEADPEEERAFLELSVKEIENSLGEDARTIRELEPDEETLRALESLEELWRMLKEPRDKKKLAWQHKMLMRRKIRHLSECRHIAADVTACEVQCLPAYDRPTDGSAEDPVFDPADELLLEILVLHQYLMMLGTLPEGARYRDEMAILTAAAEQLESEELATIMQPLEAMALAGDTKAEEISNHFLRCGAQGLESLATLARFYGDERFSTNPRVAAALDLIGAQLDTWTLVQRGALSLLAAAASGAPDARLRLFARVFAGAPFEESVRALRGVRCALGQASETLSPQVMCTVDFIEHEGLEVVAEMLLGEGEGSEGDGEGETEEGDQGTRRGTELAQKTECEAGRSREGLAAEQSSTDVSARRISDAVERRDESTESGAEPGCSLTIGPDARRAAGRAQRVPRAAAGEEGSAGFWGFSNSDVVQLRLLTEVSNFEPAGEAEEEVWEKLKRAASDWTEKEMEGIVHFCVRLGLDNTTFSRLGEYVRNAAARPNEGGNPIGLSLFERAERTWVAARLRARGGNPGASGRLRELCAEFLESLVEDIDVEGGLGPGEPPLDVYILFTLFQMLLYAREPEVRAIWQRVCSRTQARIAAEQSGESVRGLEREAERGRTENLREGAIEGEIDEEEEDEIEEWSEFEAELGFEAQGDVEAEGEVETEGEVEAEGEVETYRQVFDRVRSEVEAAGFAGHNQVSDCDVSSTCSDTSWQEFDGEDGGIRSPTETENDVGETGQRDRTKNEGNGALLRQLAAWVGQRETGEQWTRGSEAVRVMGEVGVFSPSQSLRLDRGLSYQGSEGLRVHEADTLPVEFSTESDECPESGSTRAYSSRRSRPAVRARGICREEGGADKLILDMAALD